MLPQQALAQDEGVLRADGDDQRAAEQESRRWPAAKSGQEHGGLEQLHLAAVRRPPDAPVLSPSSAAVFRFDALLDIRPGWQPC
jgi:hypothetical protein